LPPAQINGTAWTGYFVFDQVGVYQVVAVATDRAGNKATQVAGEITALYADIPLDNVVLTVQVVGSGVVTPSLSSYISGTVVPITATANLGWSFADWSGAVVTTTNPTTVRMDSDKIITATFTQNSYTIITATVGSGSIQLNPAQASYRYGDVVTMTATADVGTLFTGWSSDVVGVRNPITLTVNSNKAVTATFSTDSSAPLITPMVTGTLGTNGWYINDLTLVWTVTDNESPISSQSGCEGITVATETAGVTFTSSATSAGGRTARV